LRWGELQSAGLDVLYGRFPIPVTGSYDLVLASHSLPEGLEGFGTSYHEFLECAYDYAKPSGSILVITFKGGQGEIGHLRKKTIGEGIISRRQFELLQGILSVMGNIEIDTFQSSCHCDDLLSIVKFIEPWIYGKRYRDRYRAKLIRTIEKRYRIKETYVIPIQHVAMACHKRP
jgi:hypothetical protein